MSTRARLPGAWPSLLFAASLVAGGAGLHPSAAQSGLVAAYSMDEGSGLAVTDGSGLGNHGAIMGATWTANGRYGGALVFGGSDWVTVMDSSSLDLTNKLTLEAWVKPAALRSLWTTILMKEQPASLTYALFAESPGSHPAAYVSAPSYTGVTSPGTLVPGIWSHLAATHDGTVFRLYVNGSEVASTMTTNLITASDGPLRIGGNAIWDEFFVGVMDEVRIYNRALSSSEIGIDLTTPIGGTGGAPFITAQPPSRVVAAGDSTVFAVEAGGLDPISYQWHFNVTNLIAGATARQLSLVNVNEPMEGWYSVTVSNSIGRAVSEGAHLIVNRSPIAASPTLARYPNSGFSVRESFLLGFDPDGDVLRLGLLDSLSRGGGRVRAARGWITYEPPSVAPASDGFGYTVIDQYGGIGVGDATIEVVPDAGPTLRVLPEQSRGGTIQMIGEGIPYLACAIETTDDLRSTNWQRLGAAEFDESGWLLFRDTPPSTAGTRFYRAAVATTNYPGRTFTTEFALTENPISEFGNWINGRAVGLDWADVASSNGVAYGLQPGLGGYDDSTALLSGNWNPDHIVTATVHIGKRPPARIYPEVELRLRSTLSARRNTGYEVLFSLRDGAGCYVSIVRWNGALGDWTALTILASPEYVVNDGDEVKATISGNVIAGYIRGTKVMEVTDDAFTSGNPGVGFFVYEAGSGPGDFGFSRFTATDASADF